MLRNQGIGSLLTILVGIEGFFHYVFNFVADQENLTVVEGWRVYYI